MSSVADPVSARPARLRDIGRLGRRLPELQVKALIMQVSIGPAWAIERGGRVLALAGLMRIGGGFGEAWMVEAAGLRGTRDAWHLIWFLRRAARSLPIMAQIVIRVRSGNVAGARLCAALQSALPLLTVFVRS